MTTSTRNQLKSAVHKCIEHFKFHPIRVVGNSRYTNIFHCCTQKTGSQWFKNVLSDPVIFKYTGLRPYRYNEWRNKIDEPIYNDELKELELSKQLYEGKKTPIGIPHNCIGIHFYIGYQTYKLIPKPDKHKAFFILRDPRDIVISWYFSVKHSHSPSELIIKYRQLLNTLPLDDGIIFSIDIIQKSGLFMGQKSWYQDEKIDNNVCILKYEEFAQDNIAFLKKLFDLLNIDIPHDEFDSLVCRHSFKAYAKGRNQNQEDIYSHYRKGTPEDWRNYFNDKTYTYFMKRTGSLITDLGYSE